MTIDYSSSLKKLCDYLYSDAGRALMLNNDTIRLQLEQGVTLIEEMARSTTSSPRQEIIACFLAQKIESSLSEAERVKQKTAVAVKNCKTLEMLPELREWLLLSATFAPDNTLAILDTIEDS